MQRKVLAEVDRIKKTFVQEVFGFEDERHLERYIQYHQQALIRMLDETLRTLNLSKENGRILYNGLDELLTFIERHFAKYFDQDANIPIAYFNIVRNDLASNIHTINKSLQFRSVDTQITDVIMVALHKIIDAPPGTSFSYRQILFAKELQKELLSFAKRFDGIDDADAELRNLMYYLNYNSVKAFTYHTGYIDAILAETDSKADTIERLSFILKTVNQAQVKPGVGYNFRALSLKDQLNSYIIEEIEHLQRIHQFDSSANGLHSFRELLAIYKIQFSISVAQIALLIKLFMDAKVILNENVVELLRFISKFIISKRSEVISFDSLRSKYYNMEQSTRNAVKDMLLRMLNIIDHY